MEGKRMQYIEGLKEYTEIKESAVTFGKFDGLHRGHQKLLDKICQYGGQNNRKSVVCAFDMGGRQILMSDEERKQQLSEKVDYLVHCPFSEEFRHMEAEDFIKYVIKGIFHADYVVVGTDFRFGYGKAGNAKMLEEYAEKYDYQAVVVEKERHKDREISSSYIKELVQEGAVKEAAYLLGYAYGIRGTVEHGKKLGRTLGFPTFNVPWPKEKLMPPRGVYFSRICVDGLWYPGISNLGVKPTVSDEEKVLLESFLFGYEGNAYGKDVKVELLEYRRPERKFDSIEQMRDCVAEDIRCGKKYFGIE